MDTTKEGRLEGTLCVRAQITADGVPFNVNFQEEEKSPDQQARRRTSRAIAPARISSVLGSPGLKISNYNILQLEEKNQK